jgi:hypothetical protein
LPVAGLCGLVLLFGTFAFWKWRAHQSEVADGRSNG